eukprot:GAHX01000729.1.p1 GENE.GAHX01000729.1~~GAHX01000729.1.p1  ORF type:complete len:309 (-),score=84.41 GAHX01000729.1:43-969(-)
MGKKSNKKAIAKAQQLEEAFKHATDIDKNDELNPNVKKLDTSLLNNLFSDVGSLDGSVNFASEAPVQNPDQNGDTSSIDDYLTLERASIHANRSGISSAENSSLNIPKEVIPDISNSKSSSLESSPSKPKQQLEELEYVDTQEGKTMSDILPESLTTPLEQNDQSNTHSNDSVTCLNQDKDDFFEGEFEFTNAYDNTNKEQLNSSFGNISSDQISGLTDYKEHENDFLLDKLQKEQNMFNVEGTHKEDKFEDVTDEFTLYKGLEEDLGDFDEIKKDYYDTQTYAYIFCGILFILILVLIGLMIMSNGV